MEKAAEQIYSTDKRDFNLKILPELSEGKTINIFCSFTYITPNYSILFTLEELKRIANCGKYNVQLVLWDMNTLANSYFRKLNASKKIDAPSFINQKVEEVRTIMYSLGFKKDEFSIYKSSDLWKRMIAYKEEDLFQQFYTLLAQMKTKDYTVSGDKMSHLIQIPMDIFFCNHFHRLYPEDLSRPIDLALLGQNKKELYTSMRHLMVKEGIIDYKNPLFILVEQMPYLIQNDIIPGWDMSARDIKEIATSCNFQKEELFTLFRHLEKNNGNIVFGKEDMSYSDFHSKYKNAESKIIIQALSENLYDYLQNRKKKFIESSGQIEETMLNISKKPEVRRMGSLLKSTIALEILLKADGTRNTTEIARELGKSVATISTYTNKLKKANLLRAVQDGKLKRNIKGVKINFESGV